MAEHDPVKYTASIAMTYSQMLQVGYAIRQRMMDKIIQESSNVEYPYANEQIQALATVHEALEEHIETALKEWETGIAKTEAGVLDDVNAIEEFLSPEWRSGDGGTDED